MSKSRVDRNGAGRTGRSADGGRHDRDVQPPPAVLSSAERQAASAGYQRLQAKVPFEDLPRKSQRAINKDRRIREEKDRWEFYRSIPTRHWQLMSGRQHNVIHRQAKTYGIPFDGDSINLPYVVRALHDFLADNAQKLATEDDEMLAGGNSPALEAYRRERAKLARLDRREREGELLPRDEVQQLLRIYTDQIRKAGQVIERRYGVEAATVIGDALDEALRACEALWGGEDESEK